jgi:hypothetical protein
MMVKALKAVVFFSLFMIILSFGAYSEPIFVGNTSDVSAQYDPSFTYSFSSTWASTQDENITECNFSLGRPDGSLTNYTSISVPSVSIDSIVPPSICTISFTQDELGPVGIYNWTWYAKNDTYWSTSGNYTFEINKTQPQISLFLNENEANKTYSLYYQNANFTSVMDVPSKNLSLTSNLSDIGTLNGTSSFITKLVNLTNSGLYFINATFDGDQNYSSASKTFYFNVTRWLNSESPSSPFTYVPSQAYQLNITYQNSSYINNVYFVWNGTNTAPTGNRTIDANTTEFYLSKADLSAGTYQYYIFVNTSSGNESSDIYSYTVNQRPLTLTWTSPSSGSSWTYSTGTGGIVVRCNANESVNLVMTVTVGTASSFVTGSAGSVSDTPSSSIASTYFYSCNSNNANYSGSNGGVLTFQGTTTTTTSTGSSSSSTSTGAFLIKDLTSSMSIAAGQSASTTFALSNTLANNIANVSISVTGIDAGWYSLSERTLTVLQKTIPKTITITFNIPSGTEPKDYDVTIVATGKALGESSSRSTTKTTKITVTGPQAIAPLDINGTIETTEAAVQNIEDVTANTTENLTSNSTAIFSVTGLVSTFEYLKNNLMFILAIAACALIFIFRDNVTDMLSIGMKTARKEGRRVKMPAIGKMNYKLSINLKKANPVNSTIKEYSKPQRPEVLEREIKRDIKELQNVLESEKKLKKNGKIENN